MKIKIFNKTLILSAELLNNKPMTYRYNDVLISNLPVVATKISRQVGVVPTGISDSGNTTEINFPSELTAGQKTTLDSIINSPTANDVPTTTNTVYTLGDIEAVKAATGLDFDIYPTPNGLVIQFTKVLTSQEKNLFKGAVANLLVIS